jgi:hypothetical protein
MLQYFRMKNFLSDFVGYFYSFLLFISSIVSVVAFVSWFSFGVVDSIKILAFSLPVLIITLPLVLRRKAYFDIFLIYLIGPVLIGSLVMAIKAVDTFLF